MGAMKGAPVDKQEHYTMHHLASVSVKCSSSTFTETLLTMAYHCRMLHAKGCSLYLFEFADTEQC